MTTLFQAKYIAQCIEEIKQELRQDNVAVKANAVAKLTYVSNEHVHCAIKFREINLRSGANHLAGPLEWTHAACSNLHLDLA
jgi:hypothetical protein